MSTMIQPVDIGRIVNMDLDEALDLIDGEIEAGRDSTARAYINAYRWNTILSAEKYESLYLVAGIKYLCFMYKDTPCLKFRHKYIALCVAYGLVTDHPYILQDTNGFIHILNSEDLHTIKYFAKTLIDSDKMCWPFLVENKVRAFKSCNALAWIYEVNTGAPPLNPHECCLSEYKYYHIVSYVSKLSHHVLRI